MVSVVAVDGLQKPTANGEIRPKSALFPLTASFRRPVRRRDRSIF
jgi:hypothetical protein